MACKICETRRPRRACPGVGGEICPVCCGTERENSIACPLDCPYLEEARAREKSPVLDPKDIPNLDIQVSDQFLRDREPLLAFLARAVVEAGLDTAGAVDTDVREALDSLIRTYRTLQSGLYYETRPANLLAAGIQHRLRESIDEFRRKDTEQHGMATLRDADVLGVLAFLRRLEWQHNNGRKRGRAFLDFLGRHLADTSDAASASPLVLP